MADRHSLEKLFGMEGGYVLNFSDRTFGEFIFEAVGVDIHSERYATDGTSKARKLRTFWKLESDYLVGKLILALVDYSVTLSSEPTPEKETLRERCRQTASRLLAGSPSLGPLKAHAKAIDANYLAEQIRRMEASVETDPSLAIGTAKELIETCCKTILAERGKPVAGTPDVPTLTKETLKELKLVPDGVPDSARQRRGKAITQQPRHDWQRFGGATWPLRHWPREAWQSVRVKSAPRQARGWRCGHPDHVLVRDAQGDKIMNKCTLTILCDTLLPGELRIKDAYG